jgi:hypothetical protein
MMHYEFKKSVEAPSDIVETKPASKAIANDKGR